MIPEGEASTTLTRQQLYEKVWATPATILAREFGVSDVALGKACRRHKIPKPPPGYWAAKRFGKAKPPVPLPRIDDRLLESITFHKMEESEMIPESAEIHAKAAAEKSAKTITVPSRTGPLHPLVSRTKAAMAEAHANYKGMVSPSGKACLGITVGKNSVLRAIRIMNALVRALEARGFPVTAGQDDKKAVTVVTIQGEQVSFRLEETQTMKKRERKPGDTYFHDGYDYEPSGKLMLIITNLNWSGTRQRWRDTKKLRIENRLNSFIGGLVAATETLKIKRLEHERREREWAEERLRRAEAERLRFEEEKKTKQLDRVVANWQKSQVIRSFCDAVGQRIPGGGNAIKPDSELGKWLAWARTRADELDPIRQDCILIPAE